MSVKERDPLTGHQTTGHEWNGIKELNTRVPRAVWWFIGITHVWALLLWILLPAWPLVTTYTKGILGLDQQERVEEEVRELRLARSQWTSEVAARPVPEIRDDPQLMAIVNETAPLLYAENCSGCHGTDARGNLGFPSLTDAAWLWGGDADAIMETLRVGINAPHPETRVSQMMAFGRDGLLTRDEIRVLADYVMSLSGAEADPVRVAAGAGLFQDNCASCHGEDARGLREVGAPDLTDRHWIYGGDADSIFHTVHDGRRGWMPAWEDRLSEVDRKLLTAYLLELGEEASQ